MNELVKVQNNQVVASSRVVAENFEKQHSHVLRDIENLLKDVSNFGEMFHEATAPDSYGRPQRVYLMTRDGFTLLAMGFTGSKAIQFKLKYIEAFNRMEDKLRNLKLNVPSYQIDNPIERAKAWIVEEEERQQLQLEVKEKEELLIEQEPKVQALDSLTGNTDKLHTTTQIATNYGMSAIKMNKLLHQLGVQYKQAGVWKLYAKYEGKGYTSTPMRETEDGYVYKTMLWTPKGEYFLYKLLIELGYTSTSYDLMFKEQDDL